MSDLQNGLDSALKNKLPRVHPVACQNHLSENLKQFGAATAKNLNEFRALSSIRDKGKFHLAEAAMMTAFRPVAKKYVFGFGTL